MSQLQLAYTLPYLGRTGEAAAAAGKRQRLKPGFAVREAARYYTAYCFEPPYIDRMVEGLRKAGLPEGSPGLAS